MADFKPIRTISSKVNTTDIPLEDGQIIFALDTKETWIDRDNNGTLERIQQGYTIEGTASKEPEWLVMISDFLENNGQEITYDSSNHKYKVDDEAGDAQNIINLYTLLFGNVSSGKRSVLEDLGYTVTTDDSTKGANTTLGFSTSPINVKNALNSITSFASNLGLVFGNADTSTGIAPLNFHNYLNTNNLFSLSSNALAKVGYRVSQEINPQGLSTITYNNVPYEPETMQKALYKLINWFSPTPVLAIQTKARRTDGGEFISIPVPIYTAQSLTNLNTYLTSNQIPFLSDNEEQTIYIYGEYNNECLYIEISRSSNYQAAISLYNGNGSITVTSGTSGSWSVSDTVSTLLYYTEQSDLILQGVKFNDSSTPYIGVMSQDVSILTFTNLINNGQWCVGYAKNTHPWSETNMNLNDIMSYAYPQALQSQYNIDWAANKNYSIGSFVIYNHGLYRCITSNTDSVWTSSHWDTISSVSSDQITTWAANTTYVVDDLVIYQNLLYQCTTANSDSTFTVAHWQLIGDNSGGSISSILSVDSNGCWVITNQGQSPTYTNIPAQGPQGIQGPPGQDGQDGQDGRDGNDGSINAILSISNDGYWVITDPTTGISTTTNTKAQGEPGVTPADYAALESLLDSINDKLEAVLNGSMGGE